MKLLVRIVPWLFLALFGAELVAVMLPKKDREFHTREFGRLPVLLNGRLQPFDSVARNALLQIRSTGDLPLEQVPSWKFWHHPKRLRSTEWLLEVMFKPALTDTRPIFLIHHPDLKLNDGLCIICQRLAETKQLIAHAQLRIIHVAQPVQPGRNDLQQCHFKLAAHRPAQSSTTKS